MLNLPSQKHSGIMKPSLYLGGSLLESQLLWILPVAAGYCQQMGIDEIIMEDLPKRLSESCSFNFVRQKNIMLLPEQHSQNLVTTYMPAIVLRLIWRIKALPLAFRISRKTLLKQKNWDQCQLVHAVWDTALMSTTDTQYKPSFKALWSASVQCLFALDRAKKLHSIGVRHAFMGHTVYTARAMKIGFCHDESFRLFAHAGDSIYRRPCSHEQSFHIHALVHWKYLFGLMNEDDINDYALKRQIGISAYEDASKASALPVKKTSKRDAAKNVIFLHVFRDSPFDYIDNKRIFADYVEWLRETLRIIATSSENWEIRVHPSAERWGENQQDRISSVLDSLGMNHIPNNISIQYEPGSNLEVFQTARRIVTYAGSSALEACCYGRKPITISMTTPESFSKALVNKPCNLQEYIKLLLLNSSSAIFDLNANQVSDSWRLLYAVEKLIPLKPRIRSLSLYRGDTPDKFDLAYASTAESLNKDTMHLLSRLGKHLASGELSATHLLALGPDHGA